MSGWWDTAALASIASNAIKTAQKKIDKVLDIKEQEEEARRQQELYGTSALSIVRPELELSVSTSNDDISSERDGSVASPGSRSSRIVSPRTSGQLFAVKISSSAMSKSDSSSNIVEQMKVVEQVQPQGASSLIVPDDAEVQDLTAESSSLLIPVTEKNAAQPTTPNTEQVPIVSEQRAATPVDANAQSEETPAATEEVVSPLLASPSSAANLVPTSASNMVSSSEDTLVQDKSNQEESTSPHSIESPSPPSEAASSSCMGSELIRVEVAPSTSSDIEIVSTPSSCLVEGYTTVSAHQTIPVDSSRHFRPLAPARVSAVESSQAVQKELPTENQQRQQQNDQTAAQLMRQLAEITRALEKKDSRILELSDENTILHNQLTEIRRQMDAQAAQEAQFGADTVRLLKNEIKDRDQIISELREEGEKLSKHQAQSTALIRKVRAKEKENDAQLQDALGKNEELQTKIITLERNLTLRMEGERQSAEMVQQMTNAVKRMEKEVQEKEQNISEVKSELLTLEQRVSSQGDSSKERESKLLERIDQLGELVRELEERALTSERQRRQEISELVAKLEQVNSYAEELREDATSATQPVVKQLESLQQSYAMASKSWNETEKSMASKISHLEQNWSGAEQRAREAEQSSSFNEKRRFELEKSLDVLKTELTRVHANSVQLEADRDLWKRRVSNLESMCEQERARAAGYERRATESESRLSMSSTSNQRRCHEVENQLAKLERDHSDLAMRYDKLLEMYGEKAEEAEELRNDVAELRQVFRDHFASYGSPSEGGNNKSGTPSPNSSEVR